MSDVAQGPGWWIASDGKWYPPEQHPSVREKEPVTAPSAAAAPNRAAGGASRGLTTSGPKFQNMFQAALRDSPVADSVTVRYDGADEYRSGGGSGAGATGASLPGGGSKKKWRKGR